MTLKVIKKRGILSLGWVLWISPKSSFDQEISCKYSKSYDVPSMCFLKVLAVFEWLVEILLFGFLILNGSLLRKVLWSETWNFCCRQKFRDFLFETPISYLLKINLQTNHNPQMKLKSSMRFTLRPQPQPQPRPRPQPHVRFSLNRNRTAGCVFFKFQKFLDFKLLFQMALYHRENVRFWWLTRRWIA